MDRNPLHRLLGLQREDLPADLAAAVGDLERLGRERPALAAASAQLGAVLRAAFAPAATEGAAGGQEGADVLREAVAAAARDGTPLFRVAPPTVSDPALAGRSAAICRALGPVNRAAAPLRAAIRGGIVAPGAWARAVLAGEPGTIEAQARQSGLAPELAASVLRLALLPALAAGSAIADAMRLEGAWAGGDCPNCGSRPLLAESRGLEQRRFLRCGLCAADWPFERLRCPACGEGDHRALRWAFVEGEEDRFRLFLCDACGNRLKVVSTLSRLSPAGLLVAELATAHLDELPGPILDGAGSP